MSPDLTILDYEPAHQPVFRALNHEWITRYFVLEASDHLALENPQKHILDAGGHIFVARRGQELVGTCALIRQEEAGVFELAKMGVTAAAQGFGVGRALGEAALARARQVGARRVELLSNARLTAALALYVKLGFRSVPMPATATAYVRADVKMVLDL